MKQSHPSSIFGIIKSISIKNNNTADYSNPLQPSFSTQKSKSASLCLKHTKKDSHQMIALIGVSYLKKGGDLLSRLVDSTIGATGLNFSVRNGKRWNPGAITT